MRTTKGMPISVSATVMPIHVYATLMPSGSRYWPIHPLPAKTAVSAMPETAVGSANGMSMRASMNLRPGKS